MSEQENEEAVEAVDAEISGSATPNADRDAHVEDVVTEHGHEAEATASDPELGQSTEVEDGAPDIGKELEEKIAQLESENSELKNQYLRKQADLENYRRRMARDKEDAVSFANQQLLLDLTSVIDDFERAIKSADESRDYDAFHDGIVLIEKQLTSMLERKWGLSRFDSEGQPFDPQKHEAVMTEPREDHHESMVLEDFQKGYMLHDRVLRSAKVKVSMPAEANS
ncbi:MAG TPA: nucleotide exchange factor GrpE [Alkalispirochaeta sp.]|nr:nucleotide exchange factor GrpE [Alkalispirochaeta sp.]